MPATNFLKRASAVASYYGFVPLEIALKEHASTTPKRVIPELQMPSNVDMFSRELCTLMKSCASCNIAQSEQPLQIYHVRTENRERKRERAKKTNIRFGLTVLGIEKSVAEALILKSALAILEDAGIEGSCVHINSIGDRDSVQKFSRELGTYLRKNIADLPIPSREALKRDPFEALEKLLEKDHPLVEHAPRPMQFLSDASRRHLKEVLEFLEMSDIPYEMSDEMVGNRDYYSQTIFEILRHELEEDADGNEKTRVSVLARGGRCDDFTKRLFRTKLPTVSIVIEQEENGTQKRWIPARIRNPKIYFIQIGALAKLQSLTIIERLRQSKIPLYQTIGNDSLTDQLEKARTLSIPYAIIMGQREALDQTVIVRDMHTHAQAIIPVTNLPHYLKTL